jgi:alkylation response protein AidB-like acyl-CoA dehydrogenase
LFSFFKRGGNRKMDFSLTEEQKLIKDSARYFLKKECPSDLVREMEQDGKGYSPELWRKMSELGWLGLIFPTEYGGTGGSFLDLVVLLEEVGRYLAPVPFLPTVILGGLSILFGGNEDHKREFLPKIAKGEIILTMALTELDPIYDPDGVRIWAIREGDNFLINGTKIFVPYAHVADYLVCATRTQDSDEKEDGVTLFLIERENPGLTSTVLKTFACDKQCEVVFKQAKVNQKNMLEEYNKGWEIIKQVLERVTIAQCALMVGGAERVLEMSIALAKERVQFDRPIGSFQAIQHRCANMKVDLDGAKFTTYETAWKLDQGFHCTSEVSISKAWVNQAYNRICANGHQVQGGMSCMREEHDMPLYTRRAKAAEFLWGDTDFHREKVAQQLGL